MLGSGKAPKKIKFYLFSEHERKAQEKASHQLKTEVIEGIAIITISRPEALNALNTRFFNEMDDYISNAKNDSSLKAIIITGEGKAFVAGADIAEMVGATQLCHVVGCHSLDHTYGAAQDDRQRQHRGVYAVFRRGK